MGKKNNKFSDRSKKTTVNEEKPVLFKKKQTQQLYQTLRNKDEEIKKDKEVLIEFISTSYNSLKKEIIIYEESYLTLNILEKKQRLADLSRQYIILSDKVEYLYKIYTPTPIQEKKLKTIIDLEYIKGFITQYMFEAGFTLSEVKSYRKTLEEKKEKLYD